MRILYFMQYYSSKLERRMKAYPVMLLLADRRVVVVGGGAVAARKVRRLKELGARVTLIADQVAGDVDLTDVEVFRERYRAELLGTPILVFACTDDHDLNAQIAADARAAGAIVNCVDQPEDCDFYVPAVVADGEIVVAIGTGGASPALAGQLKRRCAEALPERVGEFAAVLGQMREVVKARQTDLDRRGEILKQLAGEESYQAFCTGGAAAVAEIRDRLLAESSRQ